MSQQSKPLRLLALDGGGVRGYSELVIIEELMLGIQKQQRLASPPNPCEIFDMICGTSTGGIIALMLGRLKMTINDAKTVYSEVSKDVFGKPKSFRTMEARYSARNLEKILKTAIEKYGKSNSETKLIPENDSATECKVFVCCQNASAMDSPRLLQSYQSFTAGQYLDLKIWEAARATSAAPTFFKRIKIGPPGAQEEFLDGGIGTNNPTNLLLKEIPRAFDDQRSIACVISIGTGSKDITELKEPGLFQKVVPTELIKVLEHIATDCERIEKEVSQKFAATPGIYFRFNVEHGLERIPMDSHDQLSSIKSKTINYLHDDKVTNRINEAVTALCNPSDMIKTTELWHSIPSRRKYSHNGQISEEKNASRHEALMDSLDYDGRCDREDQIWSFDAAPQTTEWIWNTPFALWASSDEPLFWICGKPASGKSTLVESIAKSDQLGRHLRQGLDKRWMILRHFFFDSGPTKDLRNNFEGFLRSLLHQLINVLGESRDMTLSGAEEHKRLSERTLQEKLGEILEHRSGPICILLDGLDEYKDDQWNLVNFLLKTANPEIKLCVASRPDPVFDTAFKDVRQINMQLENRPAIEKMVETTLYKSIGTSEFYSDSEYVRIAEEISEKANGVFLWAHFAVITLRDSWIRGDEFSELQKRLEEIPEKLEDIYARILRTIDRGERKRTALILQLVCYAKRLLTIPELFHVLALATEEDASLTTKNQKAHLQRFKEQHFKRKLFTLTGGLVEIFRSHNHPMYDEESDDSISDENESRGYDCVNTIHRTVRTYLECDGWEQLLCQAHQGTLHAEMLWLRVCARLFPSSFVELPSGMDKESLPNRMRCNLTSKFPLSFKAQDYPSQWKDKCPTDPRVIASMREYAAKSILDHASTVERRLGLSTYAILKPVLTDNLVCHHIYTKGRLAGTCGCEYIARNPTHPLHLAIAHGLDVFVGEFLSDFPKTTVQNSPKWDDVFQLDMDKIPSYMPRYDSILDSNRISLLQFTLWHADSNYGQLENNNIISLVRIISQILKVYSPVKDVEMAFALRNSTPEIIDLLIAHWHNSDMLFDMDFARYDYDIQEEINCERVSNLFQQERKTRPLWHIVRRLKDDDFIEDLLDMFLKRGENINGQCVPTGTALHGLFIPHYQPSRLRRCELLLKKGADLNADGPLGKPLELAWWLVHQRSWKSSSLSNVVIEWLIDHGAINEQRDPNGSVPSKEQMLAFAIKPREHYEKCLRHYEGK